MVDNSSMFSLSRRSFVAAGLAFSAAPSAMAATGESCMAEVEQGRLRGIRSLGCDRYFGIPYAGSVSGRNRFLQAPAPAAWAGVRDATQPGPPSIQPSQPIIGFSEPAQSEDCLVLNVWTPSTPGHGRPVMVYSHGGGFTSGSAAAALQDGSNLARDNDVVVVSTNHRLGLLGFLYLDQIAGAEYAGSGNRGVQDIAIALAWISRNISAFGGDPRNVMIFGESGGGMKTSTLYAMPQAAPYFNKASIESGPGVRLMEAEQADATTRAILRKLDIAPQDWRRLLDVPAAKLLQVQMTVAPPMAPPGGLLGTGFGGPLGNTVGNLGPVRDGHVMPHHPFDPVAAEISRNKPLLVGGNADEAMFFSLVSGDTKAWSLDKAALADRLTQRFGNRASAVEDAYRAMMPTATPSEIYFEIGTALFSRLGSTLIAERKAAQHAAPVFRFEFAFDQGEPVPGGSGRLGALHALDIPYKFNNMDTESALPLPGSPPFAGRRSERFQVGRAMSGLWAGFARHGKPGAANVPAWPAFTAENRACMVIDAECHVETGFHQAEYEFWKKEMTPNPAPA